jgi:hypothetical protein
MEMTLGPYRIAVATGFGPRITSLRLGDGPELLARFGPDKVLTYDGGEYAFRGGHRLWAAPEVPEITYAADDHECEVVPDRTITVTAPPDLVGLVKEIETSHDDGALIVEHRLTRNGGDGPPLAPWAITQLPLGGTAILPLKGGDTAPQANRNLVLWPYTSTDDFRVSLRDDVITIDAGAGPPNKFGVGPTPGKLGYLRDGWLFVKEIEGADGRTVPDFGAVGQVFVGLGFCELESMGGLASLADGYQAVLRERWTVTECASLDTALGATLGR